ncbi:MAG: LacI family DNA-binding transcriptional regulator [Butyricicoccus sp.]
MKPTIRSIAELCGVSRGTVDRVVHNRPNVDPDVRRRVLRAVEKTGYTLPHTSAPTDHAVCIGFVMTKWENSYFEKQTQTGIQRAKRFLRSDNLSLLVETMNSRSDTEYIRRIYNLVDAGARGIILNAADTDLIRSAIQDLTDKGIPVVTYNSDIPSSSRVCHIGQDLAKSGQIAAGLLSRSIGPQDHILAVTGNLEFLSHRSRIDSFYSHAASLGIAGDHIRLSECFERYDLTYDTIVSALRTDNRIRGIYMGAESVPACLDAVRKVHPSNSIHVVVNDLTPPAIRGLKSGRIDFVVEQAFSKQAYEAILVMYSLLAHHRTPKTPIRFVPTSIYTKELL